MGFDKNKNGVAENSEMFARWVVNLKIDNPHKVTNTDAWLEFADKVRDPMDPARGSQDIDKLFDQLSNKKHKGLFSIKPSRIHFDPGYVVDEKRGVGDELPGMVPFATFRESKQFRENDFMIDFNINNIDFDFFAPVPLESIDSYQADKAVEYGNVYNYLVDQFSNAAVLFG